MSAGRRTSTRDCCHLASTRVYHTIPACGRARSGTNYDETEFGYDSAGRQNMVKTPGGTITRTVFDVRGGADEVYVGTDDTGATDDDPTGCGGGSFSAAAAAIPTTTWCWSPSTSTTRAATAATATSPTLTQHVDSSTTRVTSLRLRLAQSPDQHRRRRGLLRQKHATTTWTA